MRYHVYHPAPPLGDYVERLWLFSDAPWHGRERIVPSGTVELVINLHEDEVRIYDLAQPQRCKRFAGAVVSGPYRGCIVVDTLEHASIIGAHFRPGGAIPFFNVSVNELADSHVGLEALWGAAAAKLRERLCAARTPPERFSLLENALTARLFDRRENHYAVRFALGTFTSTDSELTIGRIAQRIGLSQRRFIQVFKQEVGMSPKLFCRVRRFQHVLESVREQAAPDWARLALDHGYFDQSHFIRDFRILCGLTPTEYVRQRSKRVLPNHVPLTVWAKRFQDADRAYWKKAALNTQLEQAAHVVSIAC